MTSWLATVSQVCVGFVGVSHADSVLTVYLRMRDAFFDTRGAT